MLCRRVRGARDVLFEVLSADGGGRVRFWEVGGGGLGVCVGEVQLHAELGFVTCIVGMGGSDSCLVGTDHGGLLCISERGAVVDVRVEGNEDGVEDMIWMGEELVVLGEKGGVRKFVLEDGGNVTKINGGGEHLVEGGGRVQWLRGQGKKVIEHGWKGKKRRYDEVGEGDN